MFVSRSTSSSPLPGSVSVTDGAASPGGGPPHGFAAAAALRGLGVPAEKSALLALVSVAAAGGAQVAQCVFEGPGAAPAPS